MSKICRILLICLPFLVADLLTTAWAQESESPIIRPDTIIASPSADTLRQVEGDTVGWKEAKRDTVASLADIPDSLERMNTPSLVGSVDRSLDSAHYLTQRDLNFLDYRYFGGVLKTFPGSFVREQFSAGKYSEPTLRGNGWFSIAFLMDGRPLNDPEAGIYNMHHFSPEYTDRIEIITGPRAFLYGLNSTGGAVNFVTKNYNSNRAFSKINYTQTAYGYEFSDGTYSQNISRKINLTVGFQHQGTDGRFQNSADNQWNMRVKVRYNPMRNLNVILSDYFTSTHIQLNGGVDVGTSITLDDFGPLPTVVNNESYEKITRHNVDVSFVGTFLGDTVNVSALTLYYSHKLREYRDEAGANNVFVHSDHVSSWMGGLFTQNFSTEFQQFDAGANIELRQIEGSPNLGRRRNVIGAAWAKEEIVLANKLTVAGFARFDKYLGRSNLGFGADASIHPIDWLSLYAGLSVSKRFPNYKELYWTEASVGRTEPLVPEQHRLAEFGIGTTLQDILDLRISYFHRTIEHPLFALLTTDENIFPGVFFENGGKLVNNGIEAKFSSRIWYVYLEGSGMYLLQKEGDGTTLSSTPKFSGNGGIFFWDTLFTNHLNLKVGFEGRFVSSSTGKRFNPEVLAYVPNDGPPLGFSSSVDFFLIAKIGNAYVHLIWENLTNALYFITPYYPVTDRALKFGIAWQFLD